jgi:hypothetical protein
MCQLVRALIEPRQKQNEVTTKSTKKQARLGQSDATKSHSIATYRK